MYVLCAPYVDNEYLPTSRMNFDVVERIELPPIKVVKENGCVVWWLRVDEYQRRRQQTTTVCGQ